MSTQPKWTLGLRERHRPRTPGKMSGLVAVSNGKEGSEQANSKTESFKAPEKSAMKLGAVGKGE